MSTYPPDLFYWSAVESLVEWVQMLTACFFGVRLLSEYERRSRPRSSERALSRRVRELERETEMLGAQLQRMLDAERFAGERLRQLRPAVDLGVCFADESGEPGK